MLIVTFYNPIKTTFYKIHYSLTMVIYNAIVYLKTGSVVTYRKISKTEKFLNFANQKLPFKKIFFYERKAKIKIGSYCGYALAGDKTLRT